MAIIQDPRSSNTSSAIIDPTFKALRTTLRPVEHEGAFRLATRSGIIAAATAAGIGFSFRYLGTGSCLVQSVKVGINGLAGYTQGNITYTLTVVRGFTATDTGGTQITFGNIQKLRNGMNQPQIDARISNTTGLTTAAASASPEDPAAFASVQHEMSPIITNQPMKEFFPMSWYSKGLTLATNEGFRIRNQSAYAAVGTCNLVVSVEWIEYPAISTTFY